MPNRSPLRSRPLIIVSLFTLIVGAAMWSFRKESDSPPEMARPEKNEGPATSPSQVKADDLEVPGKRDSPQASQRIDEVRQYFADLAKVDASTAMIEADGLKQARLRTVARLAVISRMPSGGVSDKGARDWMALWSDEAPAVLAVASDLLAANLDPATHPPACDCAECATELSQASPKR